MSAHVKRILIVSGRPILRDGLELVTRKLENTKVRTAQGESGVGNVIDEFDPHVVVLERPDTRASQLEPFFAHTEHAVKLIIVVWSTENIAGYAREAVQPASIKNLIRLIRQNPSNSLI